MEEVEELSRKHTQKALDGLQNYLAANPKELDNIADKLWEDGKKDQSRLIRRFADNTYPGRPYTIDQSASQQNNGIAWHTYLLLIVGFCIFWYCVYFSYLV